MKRRGFALAELMVALVIASVIGVALTRLVISQARFVSTQDALMQARSSARSALNVLTGELAMVGEGGLVAASRDSITSLVPYAHGAACVAWSPWRLVSLLPADSALFAGATASGLAWRNTSGAWQFAPIAAVSPVWTGYCWNSSYTNPPVSVLTAPGWPGRVVAVNPNPAGMQIGNPVYLYQVITYRFAASVEVPGTRALWRSVPSAGLDEEMVAPFDTSARFEFLLGDTLGVAATPPASLDSVRGIRVHLDATSINAPEGRTARTSFPLATNVVFRGRTR